MRAYQVFLVALASFVRLSLAGEYATITGHVGRQVLSGDPCDGLPGYAPVCMSIQLQPVSLLATQQEPACTSNSDFAGCDGRLLDHPDNQVCCCCPGGNADPQFVGLDGRKFDFTGKPDMIFNLLSEQHHQLNSRFVAGPHMVSVNGNDKLGTYMGTIAFQAYDTQVAAAVDEAGNMTVTVDGIRVDGLENEEDHKRVLNKNHGVIVTVELYREHLGHSVGIQTPLLALTFYPSLRQWDVALNQTTRGYINMAMAINVTHMFETSLHGIVGQTTPDRAPVVSLLPPELQYQWLGEGSEDDYIVSSLFGTDFRFNRFGEDGLIFPSKDSTLADMLHFAGSKDFLTTAFRKSRRLVSAHDTSYAATAKVAGIRK